MEINSDDEYVFLFVGGTCGSFVKTLFFYYLYWTGKYKNPVQFKIDPDMGHCHSNNLAKHYHSVYDILDKNKKVIAITFDQDDQQAIIKVVVHKVWKHNLKTAPELLSQNWDGAFAHIDTSNIKQLETEFLKQSHLLITPDWDRQVNKINPTLKIRFKDIMFGNLNQLLADFFETNPLPEVDKFIYEYRTINKKYIDN